MRSNHDEEIGKATLLAINTRNGLISQYWTHDVCRGHASGFVRLDKCRQKVVLLGRILASIS